MIELNNIQSIYFIGIGGIGMSNLARYFAGRGVQVSGYDKTATDLTRQLEAEGIAIHYEENLALIARNAGLVVYTPAVPASHTELLFYQQNNYPVVKRSDLLGAITRESFNICVAGTHGKTTTTTMVAHILRHSGYGCNAFLGGIAANYNSNFWSSDNDVCVAEADEYDRSFLKLSPDIAIISSMDPDHLDIYGTPEAVEEAFVAFSAKIKPGGMLIHKYGLPRQAQLKAGRVLTYSSSSEQADVYPRNIQMKNGSYQFDLVNRQQEIKALQLNMGGLHNVENAVAAIAVAMELQIDPEKIRAAIGAFKGVKRRFEYVIGPGEGGHCILIDDYAHHPAELTALLSGTKGLFPDRRCTVVFQPHLYSRTNDLAEGFALALDLADEVVLLPIYPARELPMAGVSSEMIAGRMKKAKVTLTTMEELTHWVAANQPVLLVMAGAGDIDTLVQSVKAILQQRDN